MMITILTKFQRFERIRRLHTIISQETIKPSSPTPPHLKTHNLSLIDNISPNIHMPWVFFYQNYNHGDINILKKSLSKSLTQYYPFAGRLLAPTAPFIDCNDEGVEFMEASIDKRLDDFVLKNDQDETLDQLIPNAIGCRGNKTSPHMVAVQMSHFTCGGAAVAVSVSHKAADAFTTVNFINHWATLARGELPINPKFISSSMSNFKITESFLADKPEVEVKYAVKRFVFPNSKIDELKNKINAMGTSPVNPSRVESLTSLLLKCSATTKSGSLQQPCFFQLVNLRRKDNETFPQFAPGNFSGSVMVKINNPDQIKLNEVIMSLRKERMELQRLRMEEVSKYMVNNLQASMDDQMRFFSVSSLCRFPLYQVDFGWGKPARVILRNGNANLDYSVLMDTPSGDGIEATVQLEEEDMIIFQEDKELNAYTYAEDI